MHKKYGLNLRAKQHEMKDSNTHIYIYFNIIVIVEWLVLSPVIFSITERVVSEVRVRVG